MLFESTVLFIIDKIGFRQLNKDVNFDSAVKDIAKQFVSNSMKISINIYHKKSHVDKRLNGGLKQLFQNNS